MKRNFWGWWRDASELRTLRREVKRLQADKNLAEQALQSANAKVARRNEEIECLKRQRDATLDTLDRLQWGHRLKTALAMAQVKQIGVMNDSGTGGLL